MSSMAIFETYLGPQNATFDEKSAACIFKRRNLEFATPTALFVLRGSIFQLQPLTSKTLMFAILRLKNQEKQWIVAFSGLSRPRAPIIVTFSVLKFCLRF